jgi:hypothetical protein
MRGATCDWTFRVSARLGAGANGSTLTYPAIDAFAMSAPVKFPSRDLGGTEKDETENGLV